MDNIYNKKLIWDYINGEEISNIDDLEADYKFMIEVIKMTKDKNIYNLCSDEIKLNYEFVKSIIEVLKDDKTFIIQVANNYLNKVETEDITSKELIFLICDLTKNDDYNDEVTPFFLKRNLIYTKEDFCFKFALSQEDEYWKKEFGLGFVGIIYGDLGNSRIITRYFAKRYLQEIFYNESITLEELVHKHFLSYETLKEVGIQKYILNYVSSFDKYLADFLLNNLDLIKELEKKIVNIGRNWNNYLTRIKKMKELKFEEEATNLIEQYNASFDFGQVCYHLDQMNLGLPIKLWETGYYNNLDEYIDLSNEYVDFINDKNISLKDLKCLHEIIKLAKFIYILEDKQELLDPKKFTIAPIKEKEKTKAKILEFKKRTPGIKNNISNNVNNSVNL